MFINQFFSHTLSERLAEFVHQARSTILSGIRSPKTNPLILQPAAESQAQAIEANLTANSIIERLHPKDPDVSFVKLVEAALRRFPDFVALGDSPLAGHLNLDGETRITRGKQLQQLLLEAIESLHPAGTRPAEPLPRVWYNYVVLHDAYVEGVPNREVMARLYISEGTFNRTRRNALRGVAIWLLEEIIDRSRNL